MISRERVFGFRWFEPVGIGTDAMLMLNGQRIRMYSAIEFGTWGFNGLWPTPELARKGDLAAKDLGLNALQYHRNLGKHEELQQDDELGLLRYMEPGGGVLSFIDDGELIYCDLRRQPRRLSIPREMAANRACGVSATCVFASCA